MESERAVLTIDDETDPALLAPGMNAALAATDLPFGKIAAPLGYARKPLAVPLPLLLPGMGRI